MFSACSLWLNDVRCLWFVVVCRLVAARRCCLLVVCCRAMLFVTLVCWVFLVACCGLFAGCWLLAVARWLTIVGGACLV